MDTIVIVGGTYEAAREKLAADARAAGVKVTEDTYTSEAMIDDKRFVAMGGSEEDVCFLRALGFHIEKIIIVEPHLISEQMGKRINHVRSTIRLK